MSGLLAVAGVVVFLCLLDYPSVLGRWETYGLARAVSGEGPRLTFEIVAVGPLFGPGHYGLVDLGYYTAEWLGWTRAAFRLPVLVAGAAATVVFFVVTRRSFGFWAAVVGTLALVLNPMFLVYWHQQYVPMFSMLFLLLVVERVHWLETHASSHRCLVLGVVTLALAYVGVLLHYGPGRLYGTVVIVFWVAAVAWRAIAARRDGRPVDRVSLAAVPALVVLVVGFALVLDQRNAEYLINPARLIWSPRAEFVKSADEVAVVSQNLPIVLTSLVPPLDLVPDRFGDFVTDLIVDYRHYLISSSMLVLALPGLGVLCSSVGPRSMARWSAPWGVSTRSTLRAAVPAPPSDPDEVSIDRRHGSVVLPRLTLVLLAVTLVAPLFSAEYQGHLTISSPRVFFAIAPLYLCVAAAAGWLLARRHPAVRLAVIALLLAVLVFQATAVGAEIGRHRAFVDDLADRWTSNLDTSLFEGRASRRTTDEDYLLTNGSYRFHLDHGSVGSRALARRIVADAPRPRGADEVVVVHLDGTFPRGIPAVPIQVVFELRELGFAAAWFDPSVDMVRGGGFAPPSLIVVTQEATARRVQRMFRRDGMKIVRWTLALPD